MYTVQPDVEGVGATTVRLTAGQAALAPFVPPELKRTDTFTVALLVVRVLMAAWAFGLAVVALRAGGDRLSADRAVHGFTIMGLVVGVAWFGVGIAWAVQRTRNTELLDGRFPTTSRAIRVWLYAPVWVVLMTLTLVQLDPHPDFDVRPPIIVGGFVIAMLAPYRLMQRIFRTLVRVQPDAAVFVLYVVDTIAFGVMWWRLVTWPERVIDIEPDTIDFLVGSSLAASIALLLGLLLSAYIDRETDRSEDIRILALRTRHDHRLARLQGLDPMDRATRWALWMARQAADRAADEAWRAARAAATEPAPAVPSVDTTADVAVEQRPAAAAPDAVDEPTVDEQAVEPTATVPTIRVPTSEPTVDEPVVDEPVVDGPAVEPASTTPIIPSSPPEPAAPTPIIPVSTPEPAAPPVSAPAAAMADRLAKAMARASSEPAGKRKAKFPTFTTSSTSAPAAPNVNDSLARALARHRDEVERGSKRSSRRRQQAAAEVPVIAEPSPQATKLAELAAAELDQGDSQRFAIHLRELLRQYPGHEAPTVSSVARSFDEPAGTAPAVVDETHAPRLVVVELLRYLTLLVLGLGAAGAGWVLVGASRLSQFDPTVDVNRLEQARSVAVLSLVGGNVLSLGWMVAAGAYARRVEPSLRTWPHQALLGAAAPLTVVAAVLEGGAAGPWSLAALLVATIGTLVGVRVFAISNETFGLAAVPVNAWFVDLASAVIFVLISPLGTSLGERPTGDGLAFGATVVGLTLIVAAVLSAVVMSDFENALRGSVELARPKASRPRRRDRTGEASAA